MEAKKTRGLNPLERLTNFTRRIIRVPKDEVPDHKPVRRKKKRPRAAYLSRR